MAPGVTKDQVDYYIALLKKVRETPEWKDFMEKGAFDQKSMNGAEFTAWLTKEETRHQSLMSEAGFLAKK